jgi:hypothetical protein
MRKDIKGFSFYNNMFYTGDPTNKSKNFSDRTVDGGLIGLIDTYRDRDNRTVIRRKPRLNPLQSKVFASTLS